MRRMIGGLAAIVLAGGTAGAGTDDPLLVPVQPAAAARWLVPQRPHRLYGNSYLVGFAGMNVLLIDTGKGLILIDGAMPQGVRQIEANIRALGRDIRDVKLILSTEPHWDHASGIAALARDSGATVLAGKAAVNALRTGRPARDDPQFGYGGRYPAITGVRGVADGQTIRLGDTVVTARALPGHTSGSTGWTWRSCEGGTCASMVFAASLSTVAAPGYRFSAPAHRARTAAFRRSFARMRALPCDILITPHPEQSGGAAKYAALVSGQGPNPFLDPTACRALADRYEATFDQRLTEERAGTAR